MLGKESIWTAPMISPATTALLPVALPQKAPEPHPYPLVQRWKRSLMAMLEVLKPSDQRAIDVFDDRLQAVAVRTPGLSAYRILQLVQTLPPRPSQPSLEMVAQKVKASALIRVYNPRLYRMQRQSSLRRPSSHLFQRFFGFRLAPAQDHKVISVLRSCHSLCRHSHIVTAAQSPIKLLATGLMARRHRAFGNIRVNRL
jgi:hypothetical protein